MRKSNLIFLPVLLSIGLAMNAAPAQASMKLVGKNGIEAKVFSKGQGRIRFHLEHDYFGQAPIGEFNLWVIRYHKSSWGEHRTSVRTKSDIGSYVNVRFHSCNGGRSFGNCSVYRRFFSEIKKWDYVTGTVRFCHDSHIPLIGKTCSRTYQVSAYFN